MNIFVQSTQQPSWLAYFLFRLLFVFWRVGEIDHIASRMLPLGFFIWHWTVSSKISQKTKKLLLPTATVPRTTIPTSFFILCHFSFLIILAANQTKSVRPYVFVFCIPYTYQVIQSNFTTLASLRKCPTIENDKELKTDANAKARMNKVKKNLLHQHTLTPLN